MTTTVDDLNEINQEVILHKKNFSRICLLDKYTSGGVITTVGEVTSDQVIHTSSSEETNRYIERSGGNVYKDPHPQIIRRTRTDGPVTYEQRIRVRYLQPPPIPPPGVHKIDYLKNLVKYSCYDFSHLLLKKCVQNNHQHFHHLLYANRRQVCVHHLHLSSVNDHQFHRQLFPVKQV